MPFVEALAEHYRRTLLAWTRCETSGLKSQGQRSGLRVCNKALHMPEGERCMLGPEAWGNALRVLSWIVYGSEELAQV